MILPRWVYELINVVHVHEMEHPQGAPCMQRALEAVPHLHHQIALALAQFEREARAHAEQAAIPEAAS